MVELKRKEAIDLIKEQLLKTNFEFLNNDELDYLILQVGIGCDPDAPFFGEKIKVIE
jgi:hypothetical protein